ncbi:MAG: HAD family phosphatase [Candidatus Coatesbacteria bacterium]|nr:HAD family phosphatase [Candidatus Coatesbacteria bacterium]
MKYRAVGFDVDGTLIKNIGYCWELFHERFGVADRVRLSLKRQYFEGKITYKEWGSREVAIWRELGVTRADFIKVIGSLCLSDGMHETLELLRQSGHFLFILSGTLRIILERLIPDYESLFDYTAVSNIVFDEEDRPNAFEPGHPLREARESKRSELETLCSERGFALSETAYIGDNDNDLEVLEAVGLGIAFCPRNTRVRSAAKVAIENPDLRKVLPHILGR